MKTQKVERRSEGPRCAGKMETDRVRMSWAILLVAIAALIIPASPACGPPSQQTLSIATGGTGGVYYAYGGGLAELINRHLPGYSAVAEVTGASVENLALVSRGEVDIGFALADTVRRVFTGTGEGSLEGRKLDDLRALAALYSNALHIVALEDSGIRRIEHLRGRRVSVGAPGSGTEVTARIVLEALGVGFDQINPQRLNFNETADALRDRRIDVGFWSVGPPASSILDLATTRKVSFIGMDPEQLEFARQADPVYGTYTIRAGTYPGQAEDVTTVSTANLLIVHQAMEEDLAFRILKVLYENTHKLEAIHPVARFTTVEFSLNSTPIPFHPGAVRYYRELGKPIRRGLIP